MTHTKIFIILTIVLISCGCSNTSLSSNEYVDKAKQALDKGKYRESIIQLRNALEGNPKNTEARWLLGEVYLDLGEFASAEKELRRAQNLGIVADAVIPLLARALAGQHKHEEVLGFTTNDLSQNAQAQLLSVQAEILINNEKLEAAAAKIDQAILIAPNSAAALTAKARLLAAQQEYKTARTVLQALLKTHPTHASAWSLLGNIEHVSGTKEAAIAALTVAIENRINNEADLLKRALLHIELKQYDLAQKDVNTAKRRLANYFETHYTQGLIHFHQKQYPQALESFDLALKDTSPFLPALLYRGLTHQILGQTEHATHDLSRYVSLNPENVAGRLGLARLRLAARSHVEVEDLVRPIVLSDSRNIVALSLLGNAYIGQQRYAEAIPLFEQILSLEPASTEAMNHLGSAQLLNGNIATGIKTLRKTLQTDPKNQQAYELLTRLYLSNKAIDDALAVATEFQTHSPELAAPYNMLGTVYIIKQELQQATQAFNKAREISPGDILANKHLAMLATESENFEEARLRYQEILNHHDNHLDTLMRLAMLDELEQREEDLLTHLNQAINAHPDAIQPRTSLARILMAKGELDKAENTLGDLLTTHASHPMVLDVLGRIKLLGRNGKDARNIFNQLVKINPDDAELHFLLGKAHALLGAIKEVQQALEKTLELDPDHLAARLGLARALILQQDVNGAKKHIAVLEKAAPGNPNVLFLKANIAQSSGEQQAALDIYTDVFENTTNSLTLKAVVQQKWGLGDKQGAVALLEKWIKDHPKDVSSQLQLAGAYAKLGRKADAIAQYETILSLAEDNAIALNNLAWELKESDPQRALNYAKKAYELAPTAAHLSDTYGMLLLATGELATAQRMIERSLKNDTTNSPTIRYHAALIEEANGNSQAAIKILTPLLKEAGDFPEKAEAAKLLEQLSSKN